MEFFLLDLYSFLSNKNNSNIAIIFGDININIFDKTELVANDYSAMLSYKSFKSYTKTQLSNLLVYDAFVINTDVTDHFPVFLSISYDQRKSTPLLDAKTISKFDKSKFESLISNQNWNSGLITTDSSEACNEFYIIVNNIYNQNKCTQLIQLGKYRKVKPWISNGIIELIKNWDKPKKAQRIMKWICYILIKHTEIIWKKSSINKKSILYQRCKRKSKFLKKLFKLLSEATNEKNIQENNINILNENNLPIFDKK